MEKREVPAAPARAHGGKDGSQVSEDQMTQIDREYTRLTPGSARLMDAASRTMPRGITRTLSWFAPYPVVFERGSGSNVYDVDGNRYVDLFSNGLSLMHGHAHG